VEKGIGKVLIVRLSSLGDLVITSSLVEFLSKRNVKIHLALYEEFSDLFVDDPRIEKLITIKRDFKGKWKGLKEVLRERYDLSVDLHRKLYPTLLVFLSRSPHKAFMEKNSIERRLAVLFKRKIKEDPLYVRCVESVRKFFPLDEIPYPRLVSVKPPAFELPERYAVFVPGASKRTKMWPMEYFLELGKMVIENFNLPVVVISKEKLRENYPSGFVNLEKATTLRELSYILSKAEFVVSNDTGPAHMASALGTPLFVIFGSTIPEFGFRPVGKGFVKVFEKDLPCRPCSLHGKDRCPKGHHRCMRDIKPLEVFHEIQKFYSGRPH